MAHKNTLQYLLTAHKCRLCGQLISKELLLEKHKLKGKRVSEALNASKKHGDPVGRPRKYNHSELIKDREKGLSWREIAVKNDCSIGAAQRAFNRYKS